MSGYYLPGEFKDTQYLKNDKKNDLQDIRAEPDIRDSGPTIFCSQFTQQNNPQIPNDFSAPPENHIAAIHVPFVFHGSGEGLMQKRKRLDNQLIVKPFHQSG